LNSDAIPAFMVAVLNSPEGRLHLLRSASTTSGLNTISTSDVRATPVMLPPLEEQRRIVEILDRSDRLKVKRRQAISLLDDLGKSVFFDMFGDPAINPKGWDICAIGDLIESATYGTSQKAASAGDVPVLRMGNITAQGEVDLSDLKYLRKEEVAEKHIVRKGDVLFNRTNSTDLVGKTAVFRADTPMAYAGYLVRMRVNDSNDPEYISAFLNSGYGKRVLRGMAKSIIGMANINARELQSVRIPAAPLDLQRAFAARLRLVEEQKKVQKSSLTELDELFGSLQAKAFRGEL
jgi:type I restriction enzyme S subunit